MRLWWGLLLAAGLAAAQQYPVLPVPGSPENIEHILEDRQGRLWFSTHDDVLCFDGTRFFSLRPFGFPAVFTTGLVEDADGGIVSASGAGIYRFFDGRLDHVLSGLNVYDVVGAAPGVLIAAVLPTNSPPIAELYRVRAIRGGWAAERLRGPRPAPFLTRDRRGSILTVCPGGWCEMAGTEIAHASKLDMLRVMRDRSGCVWFRSAEAGAYQCPGDARPVPLPASVVGRNVWAAMSESSDGSMLFASVGSVAVGRPGDFRVITPATGLPPESVSCAVRTRDGSIWIGTLGGLYRFPYPFRLTTWKSRNGLVWSFARWHGKMVAGTSAGVAELGPDGEWKVLRGAREFGSIGTLLPHPDGSLYAAVSRQGIIRLRPDGSLAARTPPDGGGQAETLAMAGDGSIWAAGSGIYRVVPNGSSLSLVPETDVAGPQAGALIAADPSGRVWGCLGGDLVRRQRGHWARILPDPAPESPCASLAALPTGDLWIGKSLRLVLVNAGVRKFREGGDVGSSRGYFLGLDARGRLWRGAEDGVYVAQPAQAANGAWLHLTQADGLRDVDANHGSFFSDTDGSVWWAAATSIVHFLPPDDLIPTAPPVGVSVSGFSVDGAAPKIAESFTAARSGKVLAADVELLGFERRSSVRVRYRLLPEHKEWLNAVSLTLDLGRPRWGSHSLQIQSRFSTGEWSAAISRPLVVLAPWWFSWPSLLGFASLALGGTAGGIRWRQHRKTRAESDLPDLSGWRLAVLSPESQWVGKTIDRRYQVVGLIAQGGFATILKARDLRHDGRLCAIKMFRRGIMDEQWLAHRFRQEVSALQQIHDPSVVEIYGHGVAPGGALYLAMEYIEGGTLRDLLDAGPLSPARTAGLLRQAAGALDLIHARRIYHRDLKPENLMLRTGGAEGRALVLIDFSIAIVQQPDETMHGLSRAAGTIYYMAPEQAVGFATAASDVYSLAKIVLEMLTGRRLTVLLPHASMDLPDRVREMVRSLPVRLSAESVDLLGSALEFDPAHRPQSVKEFSLPLVRDLSAVSCGSSANFFPDPKDDEPAAG